MRATRSRTAWFLVACGVIAVACAKTRVPEVPRRPAVATARPALPEPPPPWEFDHASDGWIDEHGAPATPSCDVVEAASAGKDGGPLVPLGGDYWRLPVPRACHLAPGAATWVGSPEFVAHAPHLSFSVRGGGIDGRSRVVLVEVGGSTTREEPGPGPGEEKRVHWELPVGRTWRLYVVRERGGPDIAIADVHVSHTQDEAERAPLWGFADMHAHPVSQLAFGTHVMVGDNMGPMDEALKPCDAQHGVGGASGRAGLGLMGFFEARYKYFMGHVTTGYPTFDGWPRYQSQVHQQMYIDWIRRAWQGGQRLLVAHAVNNELLAKGFDGEQPYDDTHVAYSQIEAIKQLAHANQEFMEVAFTPADARRIITSGRLAIVLGVEVDAFGGCGNDLACDEEKVRATIRDLYCRGVRHYFPVHLADNALGGSNLFLDGDFDLLTWYVRGSYQHVVHDGSVAFSYSKANQDFIPKLYDILFTPNEAGQYPYAPPWDEYASVAPGHANLRRLSTQGQAGLDEMIRLGMIIDIDHMGENTRADAIEIAARKHAPVSMGHSWYRALGWPSTQDTSDPAKLTNEAMKRPDEIDTVLRLGGAIGPITNQGDLQPAPELGLSPPCSGTSSSWMEAYAYAAARAGGLGVGFGTDFDGLAEEPGPRFGTLACMGMKTHNGDDDANRAGLLTMQQALRVQANSQSNGVTYSLGTPMHDVRTARFPGAQSGAGPYTARENAIWLAVASRMKGVKPAHADYELTVQRAYYDHVIDGLFATSPPSGSVARDAYQALVDYEASARKHDATTCTSAGSAGTGDYAAVLGVLCAWSRMVSGNLDHPLERYTVPVVGDWDARDFDVNIDGLAHYGLLPDFLQDVANQLKSATGPVKDLSALFRSAEAYVEEWERAEAASEGVSPSAGECTASKNAVATPPPAPSSATRALVSTSVPR